MNQQGSDNLAPRPRLPWQSIVAMIPLAASAALAVSSVLPPLRLLFSDSIDYIHKQAFGLPTFKGTLVLLCGCISTAVFILWVCAPLALLRRKPAGLVHGLSILVYMECIALALGWFPGHPVSLARQIWVTVVILGCCALLLTPRIRPYYAAADWSTKKLLGRGISVGVGLIVLFRGSVLALLPLARWLKS